MSNTFVVCMGIGVVFFGLLCIVILTSIMGAICKTNSQKQTDVKKTITSAPVVSETIPNRQEMIAAVSAAIAEELGTDISAIRVHSFKKI